jgi:methionyl-tRNA synthetase
VYLALEHTRIAALLLQPIIPDSISTALEYLGIPAEHRNPFKFNAGYQYNTHIAAAPGTKPPLVLFAKPVKPGVVQKEKPVKTKPTKTKQ